ncbi:MAG TPA: chemotaxis protein CheA [Bryobacteraceae bacterium]|nr:chemotaxis protein CheA [Bryobacteraceae bacterium]
MSEKTSETVPAAELRAQIDGMATRLVVGSDVKSFAAALKQLSESAVKDGYAETADLALNLAKTIQGASKDKKSVENTLKQGFSILQEVLDSEDAKARASQKQKKTESLPAPNPLAQDPELVGDFITESREHLSSIESQMLALEQNPSDTDVIHAVFRSFHTIKGLAGFLEFATIQKVAHEVETLLDLARNGKLTITTGVVDVVLESADYLKQAIDAVEASLSGEPAEKLADRGDLLVRIQRAYSAGSAPVGAAPAPQNAEPCVPEAAPVKPAAPAPPSVAAEPAAKTSPTSPVAADRSAGKAAKPADTFSVRVETAKLDHLMDMVGEMVIAQSLIRNNPVLTSLQNPRLLGDISQLARITADVQRTTMGMRMIPMGQLFQRTARMVRDLSRKTGKVVELETSGEETEVDKNIAEELSDPLLHMVRNSLDHGIEPPAEREAAGKNPTAHVRLAAYHQAGQIVIEISDDGRGLDKAKILKKAQQRGLIQDGAHLSENDIFHLIFEPGFSTADQISDISGRGVGMDVVRKNVQKLRGRIDIRSVAGKGATFILSLPLTLAIIDGLVVNIGGHRYIVPIFDVKEMIRPTDEMLSSVQGRDEMALIRGRLMPIVRLSQRFGVKAKSDNICDGLLVVAECEGKQFCLLVDDLVGKQEVVIKSLGETLKNITGIAGCAILGDGRVGLILDMHGIFRGKRT